MKNITYIILILTFFGCKSDRKTTEYFIHDFFHSNTQLECADSSLGKVQLKFIYNQIDKELPVFKIIIPDTIKHSDFYSAYAGRLTSVYYYSRNSDAKNLIDSLFTTPDCDVDLVKTRIIEYYKKDDVFFKVFRSALSSYYNKKVIPNEKMHISKAEKVDITLDSLMKIALIQFDIFYVPNRGFAYHFVCGENPYKYNIDNSKNLLIVGFCQEALRNKEMYEVHSRIIEKILDKNRTENDLLTETGKNLQIKYQDEFHKMLLEDGTVKKVLLEYYEKRKNIEPFTIVNYSAKK
ncbi:MAG TPA: hypothetical protein VKA10_01980 [Prolixibacteraceae bacterium]|nr:hypothetical protein [Prolixibacteraceae bacterium]